MNKIKIPVILTIISLIFTNTAFATDNFCDGTNQNPCIVQDTDTENHTNDLRNWRDTKIILENYQGNTSGLENLWMSGSAAPSESGFKTILENIQKRTGGAVKNVIDIDLRQESHGYLNQNSIELENDNNWLNINKTNAEALLAEQDWLNTLRATDVIFNVLTKKQFKAKEFSAGKTISVHSIESENNLVQRLGFQYFRLMVTDHLKPNPAEVKAFVDFVKNLPNDTWLHFHCRAGKGRTTTFMVMYDILKNADKVSFNDIIKREAAVPPYEDLSQENESHPEEARERYKFLQEFYKTILTKKTPNGLPMRSIPGRTL